MEKQFSDWSINTLLPTKYSIETSLNLYKCVVKLHVFALTTPGCSHYTCSGKRWGADGHGPGSRAAACMAQPEQGEAAGAGEEWGEHCFQPGHSLRQPHGLLAGSFGHQQEQAAAQHSCRWLGERQQQHRHQQVRRVESRDDINCCSLSCSVFTIHKDQNTEYTRMHFFLVQYS